MNKIKRIPLMVVWLLVLAIAFTFVKYDWIIFAEARASFVATLIIVGPLLAACNSEFKFWVHNK